MPSTSDVFDGSSVPVIVVTFPSVGKIFSFADVVSQVDHITRHEHALSLSSDVRGDLINTSLRVLKCSQSVLLVTKMWLMYTIT